MAKYFSAKSGTGFGGGQQRVAAVSCLLHGLLLSLSLLLLSVNSEVSAVREDGDDDGRGAEPARV